jgi:hypothetical protein
MDNGRQDGSGDWVDPFMSDVVVIVPQKAGGSETVADMHCLGKCCHTVTESALVAYHHVISPQVKALKGQRVKG